MCLQTLLSLQKLLHAAYTGARGSQTESFYNYASAIAGLANYEMLSNVNEANFLGLFRLPKPASVKIPRPAPAEIPKPAPAKIPKPTPAKILRPAPDKIPKPAAGLGKSCIVFAVFAVAHDNIHFNSSIEPTAPVELSKSNLALSWQLR